MFPNFWQPECSGCSELHLGPWHELKLVALAGYRDADEGLHGGASAKVERGSRMREFSFIHDATPDAVARKNIPTQHTHTDRAESALAEKNVLMPASGWGGSTQGRLMMIEMFIKCDAHLELERTASASVGPLIRVRGKSSPCRMLPHHCRRGPRIARGDAESVLRAPP